MPALDPLGSLDRRLRRPGGVLLSCVGPLGVAASGRRATPRCRSNRRNAAEPVTRVETLSHDAFPAHSSARRGSSIQAMVGSGGVSGRRWRNRAGFQGIARSNRAAVCDKSELRGGLGGGARKSACRRRAVFVAAHGAPRGSGPLLEVSAATPSWGRAWLLTSISTSSISLQSGVSLSQSARRGW